MFTESRFNPVGAHTINASIASAATLTNASNASAVLLQAYGQAVRFTLDGTTPTASTGFRLAANDRIALAIGGGVSIKVIEEAAGGSIQFQWGVLLPISGMRAART